MIGLSDWRHKVSESEVNAIREDIKELKESLNHFQGNVYKILNGNGRLGVVGKVAVMWKVFPWIIAILAASGLIPETVIAKLLGIG